MATMRDLGTFLNQFFFKISHKHPFFFSYGSTPTVDQLCVSLGYQLHYSLCLYLTMCTCNMPHTILNIGLQHITTLRLAGDDSSQNY